MVMCFSSHSVLRLQLVSVTTRAFPPTWQLLLQTVKLTAPQKAKSNINGSGTDTLLNFGLQDIIFVSVHINVFVKRTGAHANRWRGHVQKVGGSSS